MSLLEALPTDKLRGGRPHLTALFSGQSPRFCGRPISSSPWANVHFVFLQLLRGRKTQGKAQWYGRQWMLENLLPEVPTSVRVCVQNKAAAQKGHCLTLSATSCTPSSWFRWHAV